MAAGRGTRMRSEPQGAPSSVRQAHGRVGRGRRSRGRRRADRLRGPPGDGVAEGCRTVWRSPSRPRARAPASAVLAAREWSARRPGRRPVRRPSARHRRASIAGLRRRAPRRRRRRHHPHHRRARPAGYGRIVRNGERRGRAHRGDEVLRRACRRRSSRSGRSTSAPTCSSAPASVEALDAVGPEDGERYLTGVVPVLPRATARSCTYLTDDADIARRRQRPCRPDGGRGRSPRRGS